MTGISMDHKKEYEKFVSRDTKCIEESIGEWENDAFRHVAKERAASEYQAMNKLLHYREAWMIQNTMVLEINLVRKGFNCLLSYDDQSEFLKKPIKKPTKNIEYCSMKNN
ncbi:hypothetical protein LOAG_02626 [Loa loa]|uniref:Uncharacterized protein n=1 Tax=Loa loa TaxID=7209 RepID=A0A1S0U6R5_LOALO|nr:hypothetical protein LOAG_02626 [Loa loa]EFO25856.1 hypothetical protein LOAG_02626 [Loa loa]